MSCILDTTAYVHLNKGDQAVADAVRLSDRLFLPQFTIAELRFGFALGSRTAENEVLLGKFLSSAQTEALYADEMTTGFYVAAATYARKHGRQLSHNDLWIAALALQHGAELLTFDKDFEGLVDLKDFRAHVFEAAAVKLVPKESTRPKNSQ